MCAGLHTIMAVHPWWSTMVAWVLPWLAMQVLRSTVGVVYIGAVRFVVWCRCRGDSQQQLCHQGELGWAPCSRPWHTAVGLRAVGEPSADVARPC